MKSILIVEDDQKISMALAIRLRANGYKAFIAPDAINGAGQARAIKPDLILLDISMPGGNGFQLAETFLRMPETSGTPIIFITASKGPELQQKVTESGAVGLFEKPFDTEKLLSCIDQELNHVTDPVDARHCSVAPQPHLNHKKILIIEDDRNIAAALTLRVKSAGYEATTAYDALTGINAAAETLPDLVLLDVSLSADSGFTVAEKIQTLTRRPIPIIFVTASKQPGFRRRANELGAAGYFEKPYEAETLLAAIQNVLNPQDHKSPAVLDEILP